MPILAIGLCPAGATLPKTFGTGIAFCKAAWGATAFCKEDARADDDADEDPCKGGGCEAALLGHVGEALFADVAAKEADLPGVT